MGASLFPEVEQAGVRHGMGVVWRVLNGGDLKGSERSLWYMNLDQ